MGLARFGEKPRVQSQGQNFKRQLSIATTSTVVVEQAKPNTIRVFKPQVDPASRTICFAHRVACVLLFGRTNLPNCIDFAISILWAESAGHDAGSQRAAGQDGGCCIHLCCFEYSSRRGICEFCEGTENSLGALTTLMQILGSSREMPL